MDSGALSPSFVAAHVILQPSNATLTVSQNHKVLHMVYKCLQCWHHRGTYPQHGTRLLLLLSALLWLSCTPQQDEGCVVQAECIQSAVDSKTPTANRTPASLPGHLLASFLHAACEHPGNNLDIVKGVAPGKEHMTITLDIATLSCYYPMPPYAKSQETMASSTPWLRAPHEARHPQLGRGLAGLPQKASNPPLLMSTVHRFTIIRRVDDEQLLQGILAAFVIATLSFRFCGWGARFGLPFLPFGCFALFLLIQGICFESCHSWVLTKSPQR